MVHGQRLREPSLPSITLVMNQNQPSRSRYATWYKPRVDTILESGVMFEGFRDDWALSRIDRRLDDSNVVTPTNRSLRTRASCPGIRSNRQTSRSKIDERSGQMRQSAGPGADHARGTRTANANPETKFMMTSRASSSPSTSAEATTASPDVNAYDGFPEAGESSGTPITRTLPVSVAKSFSAASASQQTSTLLPPVTILRPSDDASSEISDLILGEALSEASSGGPRESSDDLRTYMGESCPTRDGGVVDASSNSELQCRMPSRMTESPGSPARSTRVTSRSSKDSDIKALPPALSDLRPFLCSSPLALHRSKSMSLDSEVDLDTPPHTPTPSLAGSVKKARAPIHLLQPYDDKSFTVEVQYVQAKKGKVGGAFAAIRKALNFNAKTRETKTVNKAINKIVLPH